jgi:hypothetical protein
MLLAKQNRCALEHYGNLHKDAFAAVMPPVMQCAELSVCLGFYMIVT